MHDLSNSSGNTENLSRIAILFIASLSRVPCDFNRLGSLSFKLAVDMARDWMRDEAALRIDVNIGCDQRNAKLRAKALYVQLNLHSDRQQSEAYRRLYAAVHCNGERREWSASMHGLNRLPYREPRSKSLRSACLPENSPALIPAPPSICKTFAVMCAEALEDKNKNNVAISKSAPTRPVG